MVHWFAEHLQRLPKVTPRLAKLAEIAHRLTAMSECIVGRSELDLARHRHGGPRNDLQRGLGKVGAQKTLRANHLRRGSNGRSQLCFGPCLCWRLCL